MAIGDTFRDQLQSIYDMSVEIASLRDLQAVYNRTLDHCLSLTNSQMGFIDLVNNDRVDMEVVAVKGFEPDDPQFFEHFQVMPIRPSVFGVTITEDRAYTSSDVDRDPLSVGTPPGHPHVQTFLGVPLRVGTDVIGMIGVANRPGGYAADESRLLSTFANQVAVAIDNARLYEHQREMIRRLQSLNQRLNQAERAQLLALERRRIAGALHDRIEQHIFTIGLQLGDLLDDEITPETAERLRYLRHLTSRTADEVREAIFALAMPSLDDGGLTPALRRLLRQTQQISGLETDLFVTGEPPPGIERVQVVIHEVVREALANVVKHANARMVLVNIRYEADRVDVVLQDDGDGASDLALRTDRTSQLHYGLRNMRQQIEGLDGTFKAENGEESGFTVRITVPIASQDPLRVESRSPAESPSTLETSSLAEDR
jgi:signal transduction histidine kinase